MIQFILTTRDHRSFGVVLDDSPMTDGQAQRHRDTFGARTMADVYAYARFVGADTVTKLQGRPRRFAASGRHPRRYVAEAACIPIRWAA